MTKKKPSFFYSCIVFYSTVTEMPDEHNQAGIQEQNKGSLLFLK